MPKQINVYTFEELSDEAKQKAIETYRNSEHGFFWQNEWQDSLDAFCKEFGLDWKSWDIYQGIEMQQGADEFPDVYGSKLKWHLNRFHLKKKNEHGRKMLDGHCYFTGFCGDEDILDPIRKFMKDKKATDTFHDLMYACLQSWLSAVRADYESQQEDDYIKEHLIVNDYTFFENGNIL